MLDGSAKMRRCVAMSSGTRRQRRAGLRVELYDDRLSSHGFLVIYHPGARPSEISAGIREKETSGVGCGLPVSLTPLPFGSKRQVTDKKRAYRVGCVATGQRIVLSSAKTNILVTAKGERKQSSQAGVKDDSLAGRSTRQSPREKIQQGTFLTPQAHIGEFGSCTTQGRCGAPVPH